MKKLSLLTIVMLFISAFLVNAEVVVNNLTVSQRPGTKLVDITYDVFSFETNVVSVSLAISNGVTAVTSPSITGDFGVEVSTGTGKSIVWDGGADADGVLLENLSFSVNAITSGHASSYDDYLVIDLSGGSEATSYPLSVLSALPDPIPDEYKTTKLVLRRIPAGTFMMGSPLDEFGRSSWNEDLHEVTLTKDFYIGVFELTQKQWELVMGETPSYYIGDVRPVERVSYDDIRGANDGAGWPSHNRVDAGSFMGKLRARTGLAVDLPTEAQWEYACRAGTVRGYNDYTKNNGEGSDCLVQYGNIDDNLEPLAWYGANSGSTKHHTVGMMQANAWGLYDMHGNVIEWCLDYHSANLGSDAVSDPVGVTNGWGRVVRGGGCNDFARTCRSACRYDWSEDGYDDDLGFRICFVSVQQSIVQDNDSVVATLDSRNYNLTVSSEYGAPVPSIGTHNNYCWQSTVTCSVDSVVGDVISNYFCSGWNGSGSVPVEGNSNDTGKIVLMDVDSSIEWQWVKAPKVKVSNVVVTQRPGTKLVDITYDVTNTEENVVMVSLVISNGESVVECPSVTGDVGTGVSTGTGRSIVWNGGVDADQLLLTNVSVYVNTIVNFTEDYLVIDLSAGASAENYPLSVLNALPDPVPDEYKTTKLVLRRIPAGTYMMGSPANELGRYDYEDLHEVTITEPFYMGVFELTQKQWELVMGNNPSFFKADKQPVEWVNYDNIRGTGDGSEWPTHNRVDADSFMGKLRARTGRVVDLPTEAQWEYVCRAGTVRAYNDYTKNNGDGNDCLNVAGIDVNLEPLGVYYMNDPGHATDVGTKQANAWGLYDMHGNVYEWCLDWWTDNLGFDAVSDPVGVDSGLRRVKRGGSWNSGFARSCRSACRSNFNSYGRSADIGLRICIASFQQTIVTACDNVITNLDFRDYSMKVSSEHGTPLPSTGMHIDYCWHSTVTCSVDAVVIEGCTSWKCTGWSGAGSVPVSGGFNACGPFVLTNVNSSVVWNWSTNWWLHTIVEGGGVIAGGDVWVAEGSNAVVSVVTAADGWRFDRWLLDGQLVTNGIDWVSVMMDTSHTVTACFVEYTLAECLDNYDLVWTTGGASNWFGQVGETFDGQDAVKSSEVGDAEVSWVETTVSCPGTLSFRWKVSSEEWFDWFYFMCDDYVHLMMSGDKPWREVTFRVEGAGSHPLKWVYSKDKSTSSGDDCVWLDQVVWTPDYSGFSLWAYNLNLDGDMEDVFGQDRNGDGIQNAFEYSFGTNLNSGALLNIRMVDGEPRVEMPARDVETLPYVDVRVLGSTNLMDWTLPVIPVNGAPAKYEWFHMENPTEKAFFKLEATLK